MQLRAFDRHEPWAPPFTILINYVYSLRNGDRLQIISTTRFTNELSVGVSAGKFPYAIAALPGYIRSEWDSPSFRPYRDAFPEDVRDSPEQLMSYVREVSEKDIKVSCLKQLQGQ